MGGQMSTSDSEENQHTDGSIDDSSTFRNPVVDYVKQTMHKEDMTGTNMTRVFVIYCGGTIGMKKDPVSGYRPVKGYLSHYLRDSNRFHDKAYADFVSHQAQRPFGINSMDSSLGDILMLPMSIYGKRVVYQIHEYSHLKDSCNVTSQDWIRFAKNIEMHYHHYDAFVIMHGTDTMAYTASALSFLLENLGKTVIITGSQVPFSELRNDAHENFLGALTLAGHYVIPEVTIFFDNRLIRGNRARKVNAVDFAAFASPNLKPLAELGTSIDIDWSKILRPSPEPFRAWTALDDNVGCFRLFPGISANAIRALTAPPMRGVVLESFGTGNAPDDRPEILEAIKEACDRGVVIVNVTQCTKGTAGQFYATGHAISQAGVVSGIDMTAECALAKLNYLLSHDDYDITTVKRKLMEPLRGELTVPTAHMQNMDPMGNTVLAKMVNDLLSVCPDSSRIAVEGILRPLMLHQAAADGDIPALAELCTAGLNVNHVDYEQRTCLFPAICNEHLDTVKWLLQRGVNIHMRDKHGTTPLIFAIRCLRISQSVENMLEIVSYLSNEAGSELDDSALLAEAMTFANEGNTRMLELLDSLGAHMLGADCNRRNMLNAVVANRLTERSALDEAKAMENCEEYVLLLQDAITRSAKDEAKDTESGEICASNRLLDRPTNTPIPDAPMEERADRRRSESMVSEADYI